MDSAVHHYLLSPSGLSLDDLSRALGLIATHQADWADIYLHYSLSQSWALDEGIVKGGAYAVDAGLGVRAVFGEKTAFAHGSDIRAATLERSARKVRQMGTSGGTAAVSPLRLASHRSLYPAEPPALALSTEQQLHLLQQADQIARQRDPRVKQVSASLASSFEVILIARLDGQYVFDIRPLVRFSVRVVAEDNQRFEVGSSGGGGRYGLDRFDQNFLEHHIAIATDQALLNLEAQSSPAGPMQVLLGPGWPGVLLHEAVGHGLEGDFNRKGTSVFSGKLGQQVAAKGVSVVDDGTLNQRRGSLSVDDEGSPTQRNVLIEDGVLVGYLQDLTNARLMGMAATGNGRRESYAALPLPRMTNTFMLGGQDDPEELLSRVEDGIYATQFGGGQVDITSGKFVFSAAEAWRVKNGRKLYPIKGATLIGDGLEVLNNVIGIGNDLALDEGVGTCGKDGQSVPVGVGQPSVLIRELTVGGTG